MCKLKLSCFMIKIFNTLYTVISPMIPDLIMMLPLILSGKTKGMSYFQKTLLDCGRVKEFELQLKFERRLKYDGFHLKLNFMFQDLSRPSIETFLADLRLSSISLNLNSGDIISRDLPFKRVACPIHICTPCLSKIHEVII